MPHQAAEELFIKETLSMALGINIIRITGYYLIKTSIDARAKKILFIFQYQVFIDEPFIQRPLYKFNFNEVLANSKKVIIIGAGPAGLFAALKLLVAGIKPIIVDRGKAVQARRRDLANMIKTGEVNEESNYCFGEGGAGTYSDGKLYTRSSKRGNVNRILQLFHYFGANEEVLYQTHPHIGTNKLPKIITAIRQKIIDCGGVVLFDKKVVDIIIEKNCFKKIKTADDDFIEADACILATGHSARDIFVLLNQKKIKIEAKPFALGVRVEHPQSLIDSIQYKLRDSIQINEARKYLSAAPYNFAHQVDGCGIFSFCMCPGGIIAPVATNKNEIVVNGWSPSKRNSAFANSGIVVTINQNTFGQFNQYGALAAMYYQQQVEQKCFEAGGGKLKAPAQRLTDFLQNKLSSTLPTCSYLPGLQSAELKTVLPNMVLQNLQKAFLIFNHKMKGFITQEAVVVATESRTSSPVTIPRDKESLQHPQIKNLYPCGEGAGYAGGIVSAAMDGENVAEKIISYFK